MCLLTCRGGEGKERKREGKREKKVKKVVGW